MKHLVIGLGEVGTAIRSVLGNADGWDISMTLASLKKTDVLHICYPYSPGHFAESVKRYVERTEATLVIVHSTVPLGTCDPHQWVHSPVRGVHPELEKGVRTFRKFFGGKRAQEAAAIFNELGIKVVAVPEARDTEAMKLWDTTIYGWNILIEKAIKAYCLKNDLDFDTVYTLANYSYNEGYGALDKPHFSKYILKDFPGPIGGHCVQENWELLEDPIAGISKNLHKELSGE